MGKDEGNCIYCGAVNSYNDARCVQCGEELPWANWAQARQQPSEAVGAELGSFAKRGEVLSVGMGPLPRGIIILGVVAVIAMVGFYMILNRVSSSLKQISPDGARPGVPAAGVPAAGSGTIVEKFKKTNPTLQQDQKERQEEEK
jgi:hypothetical protein